MGYFSSLPETISRNFTMSLEMTQPIEKFFCFSEFHQLITYETRNSLGLKI
jgi:hypothetical protein